MPIDDLLTHATSSHDFYALLEIKTTATESDIKRGYRRAALRYHPDKVGDDAEAKEKFHWIGIANAVLTDPAARAAYDAAREAKARQQRERDKLEEGRRRMAEALEAGERGTKRVKVVDGVEDAEERLQREIRRIQEANRKMMDQKQKAKQENVEALEEQVRMDREQEEKEKMEEEERKRRIYDTVGGTTVDALERTVKVKWRREGLGVALDREGLPKLFSRFGKVQHASSSKDKDKKQRVGESREKKVIATGFVVFESVVGAHAPVEDAHLQKGKGDEWEVVESVQWQKEPTFHHRQASSPQPDISTPAPAPSTPISKVAPKNRFPFSGAADGDTPSFSNGQGLKKVPSFASFSRVASSTPRQSPMANRLGPNSPSLEELTLMRLKDKDREKERKRLNEQIEREEASTEAA
jgi:DnaJ family protein C protein 17